jgi:hypothetical protein
MKGSLMTTWNRMKEWNILKVTNTRRRAKKGVLKSFRAGFWKTLITPI